MNGMYTVILMSGGMRTRSDFGGCYEMCGGSPVELDSVLEAVRNDTQIIPSGAFSSSIVVRPFSNYC